MPGLDVKPLLEELKDRISEELDYELEAMSQQMFADAYAGDPDIYVPSVVMATGQVLVSEWMDGTPLSRIIAEGSKEQRDRAGIMLVRFLFSGPSRAGLLHADPHPGNFRLLGDGRLGVLDFGAVDRLPGGLPRFFGRLLRIMHDDDADIEEVERELRAHGFLRDGIHVDLDALHAFLAPLAEPSKVDSFKFTREWMREEASRVTDMRAGNISRQFNVPPSYVLIHRVSTAPGAPWRSGGQPVIYSSPSGTSRPMARRCAACSLRITCMTALISARCVNACGKLPRCRPEHGSISSP